MPYSRDLTDSLLFALNSCIENMPTTVISDIPAFYPRLEKLPGGVVEISLSHATPGTFVFKLASTVQSLDLIDGWHARFSIRDYVRVHELCRETFGNVEEIALDDVRQLKVDYIGQCRAHKNTSRNLFGQRSLMCKFCRGKGLIPGTDRTCPKCRGSGVEITNDVDSYASAWVDGGWTIRFPEEALKKFFPVVEHFDGDFLKLLLKEENLSKAYKRLAKEYHPDLNPKGAAMFRKLRAAYETLSDPMRRKRYEAGLKFQLQTVTEAPVFIVPKRCGLVTARIDTVEVASSRQQYGLRGSLVRPSTQIVTEIISWIDIRDAQGRVMTSTWKGGDRGVSPRSAAQPFVITWEDDSDIEFEVNI